MKNKIAGLQQEIGVLSFDILQMKTKLQSMEELFKIKTGQLGVLQELQKPQTTSVQDEGDLNSPSEE